MNITLIFFSILSFIAFIFHIIPFIFRNTLKCILISKIPILQMMASLFFKRILFAIYMNINLPPPPSFYNYRRLVLLTVCITKLKNSSLNYKLHVYTKFTSEMKFYFGKTTWCRTFNLTLNQGHAGVGSTCIKTN